MVLLESVPNVSEGRDLAVIAAIGEAFGSTARLLDVHSDADHHRSVYTIVAEPPGLENSLLAGVARAVELIDLREHDGIHPRIGAADVVPVVPLQEGGMELALDVARSLGRRISDELGLPVFLYGASAGGLRPAFFRRGGSRPATAPGSTPASCDPTSARRGSIPAPAACSSARDRC